VNFIVTSTEYTHTKIYTIYGLIPLWNDPAPVSVPETTESRQISFLMFNRRNNTRDYLNYWYSLYLVIIPFCVIEVDKYMLFVSCAYWSQQWIKEKLKDFINLRNYFFSSVVPSVVTFNTLFLLCWYNKVLLLSISGLALTAMLHNW